MANQEDITQQLGGQVALVTGGGRGLGRAYAQALAQAGMAVAVTARTEPELQETAEQIEQSGGHALAIAADVTDPKAVEQMVATVERQLGPVDLLVNNAGRARAIGLVAEVEEDEWWREMEVNLRGPFLFARYVLPHMIARGRGRIVNVASNGGVFVVEGASAYCIGKTALIRLSQFLAVENRSHGIAVFAIHPGTVNTAMYDYLRTGETVRRRVPHIQERFQTLYQEDALHRVEQSVALVMVLASGKVDALSGRFISVDDDVQELVRRAEEIERADFYTLQLHKLGDA